jgi:hypothetical protein
MVSLNTRQKVVLGLAIAGIGFGIYLTILYFSFYFSSGGSSISSLVFAIIFAIASGIGIWLVIRWIRNIVTPPPGPVKGIVDSLHYEPGGAGRGTSWIFKLRRYDGIGNPTSTIWVKIVGKQLNGGRIRDGDRVTDVIGKWNPREEFFNAKKVLIDNNPNDKYWVWSKKWL